MVLLKESKNWLALVVLSTILFAGQVWSAESDGDELMSLVPAESLFCVRVNNFDYTAGAMDQFLAGASPMPMGVSMVVRMQLAQIFGDPALQGLNTAGNFAIFGMPVEGSAGKTSGLFVAGLVPVKDYEQFVSLSPNVDAPDANGISKISMAGTAGAGKNLVAAKARNFAIMSSPDNYGQVLSMSKAIANGKISSIAKSLDESQAKQAVEEPIWAYGDIQQINKAFGPVIEQGFSQMQENLKQVSAMTGQPQMPNMNEILNVYMDAIKALLEQGKYISFAIKPEPTVLRFKKIMAAKPDTDMAKMLSTDPALPKENKLLGYMQDGAAMNFSAKVHKVWMEKLNDFGMGFLKAMVQGQDANEWGQLSKDSIDSMGNAMAMSVKLNSAGKPPFEVRYLVEIKDAKKYEQVYAKSFEMMQKGSLADMYKGMGLTTEFTLDRAVSSYKEIPIDAAKMTFKFTDPNSQEAQIVKTMYGDGFEYRMAFVNGYFVTAVGGDTDMVMKELIDAVKAGPKEPAGEVMAALDILPAAREADFVGTINYIRLMQMVMGFVPIPIPLPFDQIATKSNIAFAGKTAGGKLVIDVAIPKEHLTEIMTGVQMMMQQQMQQNQPNAPPSTK